VAITKVLSTRLRHTHPRSMSTLTGDTISTLSTTSINPGSAKFLI